MFSAQRVRVTKSRVTKRRKPGEELWAIFRRNLDGSEPRYYLSNAPVPVQRPGTCPTPRYLSNAPVPVQRPGTCPTPRYLSNAPVPVQRPGTCPTPRYLSNAPVPVQRPGGHTLEHAGLRGRVKMAH